MATKKLKRSSAWAHYNEDHSASRLKAVCIYCGHTFIADTGRMKQHLASACRVVPLDTRRAMREEISIKFTEAQDLPRDKGQQLTNNQAAAVSGQSTSNSRQEASRRQQNQTKIGVSNPWTASEQEMAENNLMVALIQHNVPWNFLDNPHFRKATSSLNQNFAPLTSVKATTEVIARLDAIAGQKTQQFLVSAKHLTVQLHGFADLATNEHIFHWFVLNEEGVRRLITIECVSIATTGEQIAALVQSFIDANILPHISSECTLSLCTDNTPALVEAREIMKASGSPNFVIMGGCMAHQTNMVLKYLLESIQWSVEVVESVTAVAKFINENSDVLEAIFRMLSPVAPELKELSICTPTPTQWYSIGICVKQLLALKAEVKDVVLKETSQRLLSTPNGIAVTGIVKDASFWTLLSKMDEVFVPMNFATGFSELDEANSSTFIATWIWQLALVQNTTLLSDDEKSAFSAKWLSLMQRFGELHFVMAHVLDPRFCGLGLSPFGKRLAVESILAFGSSRGMDRASLHSDLNSFQQKSDVFCGDWQWSPEKIANPIQFWQSYSDCPGLQIIAQLVLSYVPHSTSCGRSWSNEREEPSTTNESSNIDQTRMVARVKQHHQQAKKELSPEFKMKIHELASVDPALDVLFSIKKYDERTHCQPMDTGNQFFDNNNAEKYPTLSVHEFLQEYNTEVLDSDPATSLRPSFENTRHNIDCVPKEFSLKMFDCSASSSNALQEVLRRILHHGL